MAPEYSEGGFDFLTACEAARSQEQWAFEHLYLRFSGKVYMLAFLECHGNPDELVEAVFLRAFSGLESFVGSEPNFAGLLFSLAIDEIVQERSRQGLEPDGHLRCGVGEFDQSEVSSHLVELHDTVHWLSEVETFVLHLRVTFGLNSIQTARILGITTLDVRQYQSSIYRVLTENLQATSAGVGAMSYDLSSTSPSERPDGNSSHEIRMSL